MGFLPANFQLPMPFSSGFVQAQDIQMTDRRIDKRQTSTPNAPPRGPNKMQIVSKLTADLEAPTVIR